MKVKEMCLNIVLLLAGSTFTSSTEDSHVCTSVDGGILQCNYFPKQIPAGISEVKVVRFLKQNENTFFDASYFQSDTWRNVTHLTLDDSSIDNVYLILQFETRCFIWLEALQELHIHVTRQIDIVQSAFFGLNYIKVLDFSKCERLLFDRLISAINSTHLRSLEVLEISSVFSRNGLIKVSVDFFEQLATTKIKYIDMSKNIISIFRPYWLRLLENLEVLNLSQSSISEISVLYDLKLNRQSLKLLDLSNIDVPLYENFLQTILSQEQHILDYIDQAPRISNYIDQLFSSRSINGSGILTRTVVRIQDLNITVANDIQWLLQEINMSNNNLNRLDVQFHCGNHTANSVTIVDLAENNLEFLHPSILAFMPRLKKLDLSSNSLYKMMDEDDILFENLFSSLLQLKSISLAANNLFTIPKKMFVKNFNLEIIDLSSNSISQVTFNLSNAEKLKLLDLQNNEIKVIDEVFIDLFNTMSIERYPEGIVNLQDNPISCSECESERFLTWLLKTKIIKSSTIKCIEENGNRIKITNGAVGLVRQICERRKVLIATSVSIGILMIVVLVSLACAYKLWTQKRKKKNRKNVQKLLQDGQGKFEFIAFLSYSSLDEDFVENYVYDSLRENLQFLTGIQRDLICSGDRFLRPGFSVLDETIRCIERSAATIIVLSDNYCTSTYCHNELEQAIHLKRPIILIVKGIVDEDLMKPRLKMLYKNNVRILWKEQNGYYVLKTTWEIVCASILDLIAFNLYNINYK